MPVHLTRRFAIAPFETPRSRRTSSTACSCRAGSRRSRWSASGRSVKTPCSGLPTLAFSAACRRRAPSSRERSASAVARDRSAASAGSLEPCRIVAEAVRVGSRRAKDSTSVCSCEASVRPGRRARSPRHRPSSRQLSTAAHAAQNDQVGQRDLLAAGLRALKSFWIASSLPAPSPVRRVG